MQILKAIVDTQRTNNTIGYVNAGDAVKLNLQVISNGEIGDSWVNPVIELHGIKSDKKRVRQTDYIQVVDLESHQLEVELHEQMTTCDGLVRLQLVIKDGGRVSSSVFYLRVAGSLELDAIDSYDYIRVFDDFDTYMELVKEFEATMEEDILLLETELQKVSDLSQSISKNESERQEVFKMNESNREVQFNQTQQTQEDRFNQGQNTRESQFNASQSSQTSTFATNETTRQREYEQNELERQREYEQNELERQREYEQNETERHTNYSTQETKRQTAEIQRITNENARQTAETNREARMAELETKTSELIEKADEQVLKVDEFINANTKHLLEEDARKDYMGNECRSIRETMNSNVDYAVKTAIGEFNYLDYEGQHITANNSIEGHVKSAILKGQTLVNLCENSNATKEAGRSTASPAKYSLVFLDKTKDYDVYFDVSESNNDGTLNITIQNWVGGVGVSNSNGRKKVKITSTMIGDNFSGISFYFTSSHYDRGARANVSNIVVVESNSLNIPYFEGMQSVRMPVLTTTGKNLFDSKDFCEKLRLTHLEGGFLCNKATGKYPFKTNRRTCMTIKHKGDSNAIAGKSIMQINYTDGTTAHTSLTGSKYVFPKPIESIQVNCWQQGTVEVTEIMWYEVNEGETIHLDYEPFKSNILTVNEEVELRGIGEGSNRVEDELNLLTGELTQRFGEVVLDGYSSIETWTLNHTDNSELITFAIPNVNLDFVHHTYKEAYHSLNSDKFNVHDDYTNNRCILTHNDTTANIKWLVITVKRTELSTLDVAGFRSYLNLNPVTVQYQLATPIVKTVVLSDNVVYSYDEVTHYDGSSEDGSLIPTVAVKVPTDVNAVISSQRATIQEQTEQINTLEKENTLLTEQNEKQNIDIALNQDAINFMLFEVMGLSNDDANKLNPMAIYFANQILKGKLTYTQVIGKYPQFKDDIDSCLLAEGRSDLIVKID